MILVLSFINRIITNGLSKKCYLFEAVRKREGFFLLYQTDEKKGYLLVLRNNANTNLMQKNDFSNISDYILNSNDMEHKVSIY